MELKLLTKCLKDLCRHGLAHSKVILYIDGCASELSVVQSCNKKGEPVILIGDKDAETEDIS